MARLTFGRARVATLILVWLIILGCRVGDSVARLNVTPDAPEPTGTRAIRATFTPAPPTPVPSPTLVASNPKPAAPPPRPPTRAPTARPQPSRTFTPAPTAPPPPTADPYAGFYYRPGKVVCVAAPNTRVEGTIYDNGLPKSGVAVRVSYAENGPPIVADFISGTDPSDYKHVDPALKGKYRVGISEGQRIDGNWWVFVVDGSGNPLSPGVYFKTHDTPGCNTATVDFSH